MRALMPPASRWRTWLILLAGLGLSVAPGLPVRGADTPSPSLSPAAAVPDPAAEPLPPTVEAPLAARLRGAAGQPVRAVIWLHDDAGADSEEPSPGGRGALDARTESRRARLDRYQRHYALRRRAVARLLAERRQKIIYAPRYAPMIVAELQGEAVPALARHGDVERIAAETVHRLRLYVSGPVVQTESLQKRGISGAGVRVALIEEGRIGAHPSLPAGRNIRCRESASTLVSDHKTAAAGIVQSAHSAWRGIAPGATLIDSIGRDLGDAEMMAAIDCAVEQQAVALNLSFGTDTDGSFDALARYVDAVAYAARVLPVVAISNLCAYRMGSPEIAFNVLAVGSFSDRNTRTFVDDRHSCDPAVYVPHSAYLNPPSPHGDREEPDMVAPGDRIHTTAPGGGFQDYTGTSFAAPHVTAAVALLVQRLPALATQPERTRAILMAAARHNIEGASRLSERDGAGALMTAAADRILLDRQSWFYDRPGGWTGFPIVQRFFAKAGERVRVVVAWAHKMPLGQNYTQPTTDLDLLVHDAAGQSIAASRSRDNNFEIVQFVAPATGTLTATIKDMRASPGREYVGLAVSRRDW